jgi:putative membrane protein
MNWDFKPSVVIGCCALLAAYLYATRGRVQGRAAAWFTGAGLIFLSLCSPADELADKYLFCVHMAKHILFVLVVPALLLIGIPGEAVERALQYKTIRAAERTLRQAPVCWLAGIGAMLFWHIPAFFNAALANEPLHIAEHLSLLIGGTIYWWPVLSPLPESRLRPVPQAAAYLFTSCLACTLMGIGITFAPHLLYPAYAHPSDAAGLLPLIRGDWGISAAMDQQIGGLLMWVPGCLIYLTAIMGMFARWYAEDSTSTAEAR